MLNRNSENNLIQIDSMEATKLIQIAIQQKLKETENNKDIDCVAKMIFDRIEGLQIFEVPPSVLS
ncbi:hypothetical protein CXB51_020851 [Gossypium anomalum]|uniref:Uncharacterized protein n=1 Tax=Gossypium anomalum TaxID=47600 RepID=A0A8J5YQS2_9ROSI|nr:hypothetical protein CXB51_020851 [Gossypium anomalum]